MRRIAVLTFLYMEPNIEARLTAQEQKLEQIWQSVEKTRKYFLVTMWTTIILFVLPLVATMFVVPMFINSYLGTINSLL